MLKWLRSFKLHHWTNLINSESKTGVWDWFNYGDGSCKLIKYKNDVKQFEIDFTEDEWEELISLVRRIS